MSISQILREGSKLVACVLLGAFGAGMYQRSVTPPEGTEAYKVFELEHQLLTTRQRLATLEDTNPDGTRKGFEDSMSLLKKIGRDIKAGKNVNLDDIWKISKQQLSAFAPIMMLMQKKDETRRIDSRVGEMARKYHLTDAQQANLREFLKNESNTKQQQIQAVLEDPNSSMPEALRAMRKLERQDNMDSFMEGALQGEKLANYKTERLTQRGERVQQEADLKVERLNQRVPLTEDQKDKVWAIAARSSRHYDPAMQFSGMTPDQGNLPPGKSSYDAMMGVLEPNQLAQVEQQRIERRMKAEQEAAEMRLTLPANFDEFDREEHFGWED